MKVLHKIVLVFVIIICVLVVGGALFEIYAQGGSPPGPPAAPRQIPWGNLIPIALGCLYYGILKITKGK